MSIGEVEVPFPPHSLFPLFFTFQFPPSLRARFVSCACLTFPVRSTGMSFQLNDRMRSPTSHYDDSELDDDGLTYSQRHQAKVYAPFVLCFIACFIA